MYSSSISVSPPSDISLSLPSASHSDSRFSGMVSNNCIKASFAFDLVKGPVYLPFLLVVGTEGLVVVPLVVVIFFPLPF